MKSKAMPAKCQLYFNLMELKLISIGLSNNDAIGKYVRHTPSNIILEVDSKEYKFNHVGKQVGHFVKNSQKGSWFIFSEDMKKLKEFIKPKENLNEDEQSVIK